MFVSLGIAEFLKFLDFLFIFKLSFSLLFCNSSNYASNESIREVMKFYNLGEQSFETVFSVVGF